MKKNTIKTIALSLTFPLFIVGLFMLNQVFGQGGYGKIAGTVMTSEQGARVPAGFINVKVIENGGVVAGAITSEDGTFSISPVSPGTYEVEISDAERKKTIQNVTVSTGTTTRLEPVLDVIIGGPGGIVIQGNPIKVDAIVVKTEFDAGYVAKFAGPRGINDLAGSNSQVYVRRAGETPSMRGARPSSTAYYIDGVKAIGVPGIANGAIGHMEIIHGGIPAEFGDVTGGIINVTTKNPRMVAFQARAPKAKKKKSRKSEKDENDSSWMFQDFDYELAANKP